MLEGHGEPPESGADMTLGIDPAELVVAQARILRDTWQYLTKGEARYIAHCMVRHNHTPNPTHPVFGEIQEFHIQEHEEKECDHTHLDLGWPK
jgi:hypothetical protein